jgi:hypothetical protein
MTVKYELGTDSSDAIQLYPEYDYKDPEKLIESSHRTLGGREYHYKFGDYRRFEFTVKFVPLSAANVVNSWYNARSELLFFVTSDSTTDVYSVMIMNNESPLSKFEKPYITYKSGKIILETY